MPVQIRVLDPASGPRKGEVEQAARADTIAGKRVGFLSNGWRSFDAMISHLSEIAVDKYEARGVVSLKNPNAASSTPAETVEELVTSSDAAVVGIGH